jgi:hypothetical protein
MKLSDFEDGVKFTATFKNGIISIHTDVYNSVYNRRIYLCQNMSGANRNNINQYGYRYSYRLFEFYTYDGCIFQNIKLIKNNRKSRLDTILK